MDTNGVPVGERRLQDIVDAVQTYGDTVEADYLEAKSDVDVTSKLGEAKIAKFILGAANRNPAQALKHFGGYAVMVIGAGTPTSVGIPAGTESHELHDKTRRYLGSRGPQWDLARLPLPDGREILFVIVDPPAAGQPPFLCWSDFQPDVADKKHALRDGEVFVRPDSSTRRAKAVEVEALVQRALASAVPVGIEITTTGPIYRIERARDALDEVISDAAADMPRADPPSPRNPFETLAASLGGRGPSREQFQQRLVQWSDALTSDWPSTLDDLAAAACDGLALHIVNTAPSHLPRPRIDITFPGCRALDWRDPDRTDLNDLIPPVFEPEFGYLSIDSQVASVMPPTITGYPVQWRNTEAGMVVTLTPTDLRSQTPWDTDDDDYVVVTDGDRDRVTATWVATVEGMGETFRGELDIAVTALDAPRVWRLIHDGRLR